MKNNVFIIIPVLILIFSIAAVSAVEDVNQTNEIYVNGSQIENGNGSLDNPYNNFKSALDNSQDNTTIYISSGIYTGDGVNVNLTIDKSLNLVNWDGNDVVFDGLSKYNIFNISSPTINIDNIIFKNGQSDYGGALYFSNGLTNSKINANFLDNYADFNAGSIFIDGEVINNTFNGLFSKNCAYEGGAIYITGLSYNNIFNATFLRNNATFCGGVIYFKNISRNNTFSGKFLNNNAIGTYGSAIYFFENSSQNIFNGDFFNNYARTFAAIMFDGHSYEDIFSGNYMNNYGVQDGAVAYFSWNLVNDVFSGNFINNTVKEFVGGAICIRGESHNCTFNGYFERNYAVEGGAIAFSVSKNDVITGKFINNSAHAFGSGLVFSDNVDNLYLNATFINNYNQRSGAAICFYNNFAQNVTNSIIAGDFINNTADRYGGAIYFYTYHGKNNIIQANFYNNTAPRGAAIYLRDEMFINSTFINSKFISNKVQSSALDYTINDNNLIINASLKGYHNYINAIYSTSNESLHFVNVTYLNGDGIVNVDDITLTSYNLEAGQNLTLEIYKDDVCVLNVTNITDNDGYASFDYSDLAYGNYTCRLYHNDDDYYTFISQEFDLTINPFLIEVNDLVKYYSAADKLIVNLTDREGKSISKQDVIYNINGINYTRTTNDNGSAELAINLSPGEYPCIIYVNASVFNVKVTVLSTVNGSDIVKVFRNATQYYATFLDSAGNYLENGTVVRFNVNGVMYDREINENNGLAKLNINLEAGRYIITAMNLVTGESIANNITVIPRIVENYDLVKYFRNASQYSVKVIGDDGKSVGAGEIVTFNINGVFYNRTTNESGIAQLNINLNPGDFIITAEYNKSAVSNNITVLPILTADDLNKKYGNSTPFEAKLVDGQGNPYSGQNIEFNVHGLLYNRTTDDEGIARLNINLQAGEYIITSTYNKAIISNRITIRN